MPHHLCFTKSFVSPGTYIIQYIIQDVCLFHTKDYLPWISWPITYKLIIHELIILIYLYVSNYLLCQEEYDNYYSEMQH